MSKKKVLATVPAAAHTANQSPSRHGKVRENDKLEAARKHWQPRTSRKLTHEDARQIADNFVEFIRLLQKWDRTERVVAGTKYPRTYKPLEQAQVLTPAASFFLRTLPWTVS